MKVKEKTGSGKLTQAASDSDRVPNEGVVEAPLRTEKLEVAVLTGGWDRHYALDLARSLISEGIGIDFIGSDEVDGPELHGNALVRFLNLRGEQRPDAGFARKALRLLTYYVRLTRYAFTSKKRLFHILWHNKFQFFDRTFLLFYYRCLGKRIVFTAHNVNAGRRDGRNTLLNRWALAIQYRLVDHVFVHTEAMKRDLREEFGVCGEKVTVIPYGMNSTVPDTELTSAEARERLGLKAAEKVVLFFGNIAPYKGLEYLVEAMVQFAASEPDFRLIIAGKPKDRSCRSYWEDIRSRIAAGGIASRVIERIEYVPDSDMEIYFKAADVLVLPYTHIFQSGVLFLGYQFGLPVIVSDVGSLKEDVIEGGTGFVCEPKDARDVARCLEAYFSSDLYSELESRRKDIREIVEKGHSWAKVGRMTKEVYRRLEGRR